MKIEQEIIEEKNFVDFRKMQRIQKSQILITNEESEREIKMKNREKTQHKWKEKIAFSK